MDCQPRIKAREYLAKRLVEIGSNHVFGVSGDYCAPWFEPLSDDAREGVWADLTLVPCSQEQEAGYAAEGFAKASGSPGVVCATYGVGIFNTVNATTSALVEGVPIIVLNGSPSEDDFLKEDNSSILYHHMIPGGRRRELNLFENITGSSAIFGTPNEIPFQIDAAISCAINQRKPVYLEIPIEKWESLVTPPAATLSCCKTPGYAIPTPLALEQAALAAKQIHDGLAKATNPIIWAGVEIARRGLQDKFLKFLDRYKIPFVVSHVGKGVVSEGTKNFAGILSGAFSEAEVTQRVQESDYVLRLGVWATDLDTGGNIAEALHLKDGKFAFAQRNVVQGHDRTLFTEVTLDLLFDAMMALGQSIENTKYNFSHVHCAEKYELGEKPTYDSFASILGESSLLPNAALSVDATLALFANLCVKVEQGQWFNELLWGSIGWTGGASNGIALGLQRHKKYSKVVTIVGDGGFQNCPFGLSTTARFAKKLNLDVTYVVFNNGLYSIDEYLVSLKGPCSENPYANKEVAVPLYNTLAEWSWSDLAVGMGVDRDSTKVVSTNAELQEALAWADKTLGCKLIQVNIPQRNTPKVCGVNCPAKK